MSGYDTVGAGDTFSAACLQGFHPGLPLDRAARFANSLGAIPCVDMGKLFEIANAGSALERTSVLMSKWYIDFDMKRNCAILLLCLFVPSLLLAQSSDSSSNGAPQLVKHA
jgi:hypothetical protein